MRKALKDYIVQEEEKVQSEYISIRITKEQLEKLDHLVRIHKAGSRARLIRGLIEIQEDK